MGTNEQTFGFTTQAAPKRTWQFNGEFEQGANVYVRNTLLVVVDAPVFSPQTNITRMMRTVQG